MSKKRNKASKHMKESTSFGRHLTGAMRERGWGLDELQSATKVSRTMLEALCNEDFSALPAEVYARGFVRSCAVALELDEGELLPVTTGPRDVTMHRRHGKPAVPSRSRTKRRGPSLQWSRRTVHWKLGRRLHCDANPKICRQCETKTAGVHSRLPARR